jgi:hypothetical protein
MSEVAMKRDGGVGEALPQKVRELIGQQPLNNLHKEQQQVSPSSIPVPNPPILTPENSGVGSI